MNVLCYTYDADHHCENCTREYISTYTEEGHTDDYIEEVLSGDAEFYDGENNPIHPMFDTEEWYNIGYGNQTLTCGDCGVELDTYKEDK